MFTIHSFSVPWMHDMAVWAHWFQVVSRSGVVYWTFGFSQFRWLSSPV